MDWKLVQKVLNLLGILLEFASFWFLTPALLGEKRLRNWRRGWNG